MNGLMNHHTSFAELAGRKIVVLIGTFMRGGCERQAFLLAKYLRAHEGIDAQVWSLKHDGPYRQEFDAAGIPTKVLHWGQPRFGWVQRTLPVARELRDARVDILLPFTTWPNVVAGLAYKFAGVSLCIWGERHAGGERVPGIERIAVAQYRQYVANSTAGVEFLAREMRVTRSRLAFVPNGVEEPQVNSCTNWREKLGIGSKQLMVVKVANVTHFKDHATLLRAWKIVQEQWTDPEKPVLALAGYHADTYENCRKIVSEANLGATVRFLGAVHDVPTLVHACDMAAFSSRNEGMPNGVLECMAAGKAVVASDIPGIRDALGPKADGTLVAPGDAQQFARVLLELLRNRETRHLLGEANRARIREEFSVERMAKRHLRIIQENLSRRRGSVRLRSKPIPVQQARS